METNTQPQPKFFRYENGLNVLVLRLLYDADGFINDIIKEHDGTQGSGTLSIAWSISNDWVKRYNRKQLGIYIERNSIRVSGSLLVCYDHFEILESDKKQMYNTLKDIIQKHTNISI